MGHDVSSRADVAISPPTESPCSPFERNQGTRPSRRARQERTDGACAVRCLARVPSSDQRQRHIPKETPLPLQQRAARHHPTGSGALSLPCPAQPLPSNRRGNTTPIAEAPVARLRKSSIRIKHRAPSTGGNGEGPGNRALGDFPRRPRGGGSTTTVVTITVTVTATVTATVTVTVTVTVVVTGVQLLFHAGGTTSLDPLPTRPGANQIGSDSFNTRPS